MTLSLVTLVLDLYDGGANPVVSGSAALVPSVELDGPTGAGSAPGLIPQAPVRAVFRAGSFPQVQLIPTDYAGILPRGWAWTVSFTGVPGSPPGFSFYLPYSASPVYLSSLAQLGQVPPLQAGGNIDGGTALTGQFSVAVLDGGDA